MQLFYREAGEGRPIVILHGLFGSSDNWMSVTKELALHYKAYVLDARNHGQSPHAVIHNYTEMAADLKEFIDFHKIENPILIGHSMGGKTIMRFAAEYPSVAEKLIVVDISPRFYGRHHEAILTGLAAIDLVTLKTRGEADAILSNYVGDVGVRMFLLKSLYRNSEGEFDWRINLSVLSDQIDNIGEALPETAKINIPTLFIRGSESGYIEAKDTALIQQHFSNVRIETVDGASHFVHAEKPQEVIDLIEKFIEN
ncbi:alpha/beta fold hydrolase [uncultured Cytophaga sp.]|uniref:alpha/beta fold hydrolase n=1 Tax=uncultured Cytophaga sp. TaxID=160238 RepID=UPI002625865D|nr:alpha/beta fold hydrolase [uncultured Cytophaga sp.]